MTESESTVRTTGQLNSALAGRYVIDEEIGRGGMATVYRARDVRHNRKVAVKVLRYDIGAALGPERFLSEIEVTANLQHPNLLPLFDSGEVQVTHESASGARETRSLLFYVMPYVEGQTLRQRLQREGQLPVEEALRITRGIAGALDYAHRHGVVHRDLKPENVLLHEGQPLVMDFGIALALSRAGGERLTQLGISLGTPQYMSPEQATGDRELDPRSDIYSLGVLLYEMLAGAPPHTGTSVQAVIAKVIMDRPSSIRLTRALVPEHVDAALTCAMAKLPADRYGSASDFARALTGEHALVAREPSPVAVELPTQRTVVLGAVDRLLARPVARKVVMGSALLVILGSAAAVGAAAAVAWFAVPERPYAKFPVAIPDNVQLTGDSRSVAISPDGSRLAVVGTGTGRVSRLLTRPMAGVEFVPLHGTESAQSPNFSPDGKGLLYVARGRLMKVSSEGGAPLSLADSTDGQHSWGDGDVVVFTRGGTVRSVPAGGGSVRLVARPDSSRGERALAWPDVLPGGSHALITILRSTGTHDSNHVGVVSLENGEVKDLGLVGTGARFAAPGHVIYATADGSLWAVPFSARRRSFTGERALLANGVTVNSTGGVDVAVSATGTAVYAERAGSIESGGNRRLALSIVDRTGAARGRSSQVGVFVSPRVSPDGKRIALTVREGGLRSDVWIYEIATGQLTPMTRDGVSMFPEWVDSRLIAFRFNPTGRGGQYVRQPWDLSARGELWFGPSGAAAGTSALFALSIGTRSDYIAINRTPGGPNPGATTQDIHIAPMDRPTDQRAFVATDASEVTPRMSPNGRWLAYASNESGVFQVYVLPVPGPGPRVPVSISHGIEPVWSHDGRTLYYVSNGLLLAAHIDETSGFRATRQDTLFNFADRGFAMFPPSGSRNATLGFYDAFPNGDFVVLTRQAGDSSRTGVVALVRWQQLLKGARADDSRR